jgi:hypothetical protein
LAEVYGMPVVSTKGYFVGLPWILHPSRIPDAARPEEPVVSGVTGRVDAQLAFSMDGHHWERGIRTPLFPNGPPGSDTAGLVYRLRVISKYGDRNSGLAEIYIRF